MTITSRYSPEIESGIRGLAALAESLDFGGVPTLTDESTDDSGNLCGADGSRERTLSVMTAYLGRELEEAEILLLSLSRNSGPLPEVVDALTAEVCHQICTEIWAKPGNRDHLNRGGYLDWWSLSEELGRLIGDV